MEDSHITQNRGYATSDRTEAGDERYTPFYAVDPILKYIPKEKTVWIPFDKEWSAFYQRFVECGYNVVRSDISDGKDFFTYEPDEYDIIVSNPPFSKKNAVIERLYNIGKPFAILLPIGSLQSINSFKYFSTGIQVLAFNRRIQYHMNGDLENVAKGIPFATAYFCKDILPYNLILEELEEYNRPLV